MYFEAFTQKEGGGYLGKFRIPIIATINHYTRAVTASYHYCGLKLLYFTVKQMCFMQFIFSHDSPFVFNDVASCVNRDYDDDMHVLCRIWE